MSIGKSDVAAIKELCDRGYGEADAADPSHRGVWQLSELFKVNAGNTLGQEITRRAALPPCEPDLCPCCGGVMQCYL